MISPSCLSSYLSRKRSAARIAPSFPIFRHTAISSTETERPREKSRASTIFSSSLSRILSSSKISFSRSIGKEICPKSSKISPPSSPNQGKINLIKLFYIRQIQTFVLFPVFLGKHLYIQVGKSLFLGEANLSHFH